MPPPFCPLALEGSISFRTRHLSPVSNAQPENWEMTQGWWMANQWTAETGSNTQLLHAKKKSWGFSSSHWCLLGNLIPQLNSDWQSIETPLETSLKHVFLAHWHDILQWQDLYSMALLLFLSGYLKFSSFTSTLIHALHHLILQQVKNFINTHFPQGEINRYQIMKLWKI